MAKKKSTADSLMDIVEGITSGKGVDMSDVVDAISSAAGGSKKKSGSSSKKSSSAGKLLEDILGKDDYPQMSEKCYWAVREKLQKSIPEKIVASTLTNATGMQAESVKNSVLPALVAMGLMNDSGKPTAKLKAWANDAKYEETCKEICEKVYPSSLRKLSCKTKTDQKSVISWFKKNADASETAATKMMNVYRLLSEPELPGAPAAKSTSAAKKTTSKTADKADEAVGADIKAGITVSKSGKKATIIYKVTVSEDIKKTELREKFDDALEKAYKKISA